MGQQLEELLTAEQVGEILGSGHRAVLTLARTGDLPVVRIGYRTVRFRPEDVRRFIDERVVAASR